MLVADVERCSSCRLDLSSAWAGPTLSSTGPTGASAAVRVVGRGVDPGVAGADILELAMAKGPMFSWLSYWPEEGFPKEDHPY
uniref:Uncharacterized protein n=1 Tax=Oryza brachyantha TaxID=4533 RepID=J3N378_ORYBR